MSEETSKKVYQTFNEVYRTGIPTKALDWELIRKDGTRRYLAISVFSIARFEWSTDWILRDRDRTGKPKTAFEWELRGKDGTKRFVECSVSLMRNKRGAKGILWDCTGRHRAQAGGGTAPAT